MRSPSARMPEDLRQSRLLMEFQAQQQQQQQQQRHAPRANVYEHGEPRSLFNRERSSANTAAPYSGARPPPSMSGLHSVDDATGEVYSVRSSSRLTSSSQEDVVTAPLPPPPPPPRGRRLGIDVDGDDHHHHDDSGRMYMRGDTELQIPSPYRMRTEGSHARLPTQTLMADDVVETPWNSREKQRGTNNLNVRRCCSNSPRRGRAPPPPPPPPPTYTSSSSALLSPRAAAAAPPPPPPPEGRGPTSSRRSSMAPPTTHNAHVRERAYSPSQWTSVVPSADFDPRHQRGARRPVLTPPAPSAHTTRTTTTTTPPAADVRCVASSWEEAQREVRDSRNTSVNGDDDEVERRGGWRSWALEVNDRRLSEWQRGESLLLRRTSSSCSAMDVGGTTQRQRRGSWGAAPPPPPPPSATAATAAARMTMDASRRASSTASSCWAQPIQQQQQQNGGATSRRYALLAPPAQMDVRDEVVPPMEATALSFTTAASASRSPTHRRPGSASNNNNKINAPFTSPTLSRPVSPAHPYGGMPVYATSRTTAMRSLSLNQRASNNNTKTSSSSPQEMKENSPSVGVFFDDEPDKEALRALLLVARPSITTTTTSNTTTNNNNNNVVVASTTISAAPVVGDVPRTSSAHNMGGTQSPDVLAKELVDDLPTKPSQQQQQQQQHNYHPRVSLEDLQRRDDVDDDLHHQLHAAQEKAEALARHLVKAMTDKRALQTNVLKLEELVEESSCEVGRLQRVVDAQQEEVRTSSGMEAALRAKEREVAVCDDEISRLTSMMDSHLARGVGVIDASSAMLVSQEVEAAMAEIGISHVAQREAEGRADQLAAELEVAVRQIHSLDEQLAEMERAATSQRLHEVRACLAVDANGDGGRSMSSNNNNNRGDAIPLPTSADASEWPVAARRAVARLVSYAEGLLQQNAQSARTSSREVHHLHARVDELRKDVAEQRAEAALATDACSNLRQEHHNLGRQSHAMMSALNDVRHGAQLVSEMVQSSKEEAEEVAQRVAGAAPFAQQVMRDMRAVARFLASLREMHIDEGCGAEMLRCIADGQSPAESLYRSPQKMMKADGNNNNTTSTRADAQHRIAMKRSFVLNAVEAALQNNSGTNNTNMMMSNRPSLMRESTSMRGRASVEAEEEEEEAVVVADAFDDEAMMMNDELHPRGRTQQQQRASEAGMIHSDNRYATRGGSQHQHPQHDARRRVYASTTSPLPVARPLQLSASPISPSHDEDATTPPQDDHDHDHHHRQIPSPDSSPIIHVPEGAQAARRIYDEDENDSRHSPHTQHNHHQHHHHQHSGVLDSAESASTMAYDPSQPPKDRSMTAIPSGGASNAHIHSIDRGVVLEVGQQGRRSRSIVGGDDDDDDDDVVDADSALSPLRSREAAMRPTLPPTASSATTSVRPSSRTRRDDDDDDDYDNPALNFFESSGTFAGDAGLPTSSSPPSNNNHNTSASSATHHHHPPPVPMHANNTNNNTMTSMHAGGPPQLQRSSTASPILPSDSSSAHFFSSAGNSRDISSHALPPPRRLSRDASASGTAPPPSLGETQRHPSPPTSTTSGLHDQDVLTGEVSPGSREATASPQRDDVRSMSPPQRRPDVIDAHAPSSSSSPTTTTTSTSAPLGLPQPASGTPTLLQMPQPAEALPMAPPSQSLSRPQSRSNNNNNHDVMDGGAHSQRRAVPAEAPTTQPPRINEDEPAAMMMSGRPPLPPSSSASTPTTSSPTTTTTTTTHVRQPRASSADDDDDEPKPKPQTSALVSARRGGSTASSSARSSCESGDDAQRKENVARILEKFRAKKAASQS